MEGHVTLKELDSYWTVRDLQDYHMALNLKDKLKSGLINSVLGGLA